jgi:hypothetical protein
MSDAAHCLERMGKPPSDGMSQSLGKVEDRITPLSRVRTWPRMRERRQVGESCEQVGDDEQAACLHASVSVRYIRTWRTHPP